MPEQQHQATELYKVEKVLDVVLPARDQAVEAVHPGEQPFEQSGSFRPYLEDYFATATAAAEAYIPKVSALQYEMASEERKEEALSQVFHALDYKWTMSFVSN